MNPNPTSIDHLVEVLQKQAAQAGFCAMGIAVAEPHPDPVFRDWLRQGRQAGMQYLERHAALREQPELLLPGVQSVLIAALRYPSAAMNGYAAYAQGHDYHELFRKKLGDMVETLQRFQPDVRSRIAVDSAPVAERDWALRAGIGWRGRQGQIIRADSGACLLLGEILTTVSLPATPPVENGCGECRRCLSACPTGALQPDGTVDARRCLSYWTIEHRGPIPADLREAIGLNIFGCDRCITACPWNAQATTPIPPEFEPRDLPSAEACLELDPDGFLAWFGHSAIRRAGLDGLQRNALIVLGNRRNPENLAVLSRFAQATPHPDLRELAEWAAHQIGA